MMPVSTLSINMNIYQIIVIAYILLIKSLINFSQTISIQPKYISHIDKIHIIAGMITAEIKYTLHNVYKCIRKKNKTAQEYA